VLNTYSLSDQRKQKELQTIKNILKNNEYHTHILKSHQKIPSRTQTQEDKPDKQRCAIFTYVGNETSTMSKLFKHTNLKISFKTTKTIKHQLKPKK
jgi:hypothetical protein